MSPSFSLYLNLVRFGAAVIVLLSHFAYERFTRGDYLFIRDWNLGSDAVVVFFVISGFVIAYVAREKDRSAGAYLFARATRLYSVVLPAILLTLLFDYLGNGMDSAGYDDWWWNPAPVWEVLMRCLSFTTEWGASGFRPGTNGPFWSLSYEAAYYALFGVAVYMAGWKRALVLASVLVIVGVKPLLLMPSWLLGVWLYHRGASALSSQRTAALCLAVPPMIYVGALALNVPTGLLAVTQGLMGENAANGLRFSNEFLWNGLLGLLVAMHLAGAMRGCALGNANRHFTKAVSWLAGCSFSLYLVHYPALQFWHAVLPEMDAVVLRDSVLLTVTLATCLLFGALFEHPLHRFRSGILALWQILRGVAPVRRLPPVRAAGRS